MFSSISFPQRCSLYRGQKQHTSIQLEAAARLLPALSHVFGHTDQGHLISNLPLNLLPGPIPKERYGALLLTLMITTTALVTGVINACLITVPEMGASGIVFMMIILTSYTSLTKSEIPLAFILVFILYVGGQFFNARTMQTDGISVIAHIAGGLCVSLFAFLITPGDTRRKRTPQRNTGNRDYDYKEESGNADGPYRRHMKGTKN